jgi:5'-nucleotidase/UDP-sugar diphosphatase
MLKQPAAFFPLLSLLLASFTAQAQPLQIIHTNDLHSHLDHAMDPTHGSYAAVKATIDDLRWKASQQGIDTLVLDAGDFSEDSQFYLADDGLEAWKAMEAMGYDAVEIGNHDWLMGPAYLDQLVGRAKPSFAFLGANFLYDYHSPNLGKYMRGSLEVKKAGAKIAIYGLTTDDPQYSWAARPTLIYSPNWKAAEDVPKLRARNDYVIALTHIGVDADKSLISHVPGIDLVVGGHSHTTLQTAIEQKDPAGKTVSIVQTGMHGNYVGDLLVDVEPGKPLQILHYKLVPVLSDGPKDPEMAKVVEHARDRLNADYGTEWLSEVVGQADVPLQNAYYAGQTTAWSDFVGETILEAGKADAAIDVSQFEGFDQPAGPITREQLFVLYPRMFSFDEHYGYTVWTADVAGWMLQLAIKEAFSLFLPIDLTGITADVDADGNATHLKIGGQPFKALKNYKIAMPEAIARGALGLSKYLKLFIKHAHDTKIPIWLANEQHFRKIGVIKAPTSPRVHLVRKKHHS